MNIIKYIIAFFVISYSSAAFAACEFSSFYLGERYQTMFNQKKFSQDVYGDKYSEVDFRGDKICNDIADAKVRLYIIERKIAAIEIEYESSQQKLYDIALAGLGNPMKNVDLANSASGVVTYFNNNDYYATYKYKNSGSEISEVLYVMDKSFSEQLTMQNSKMEK